MSSAQDPSDPLRAHLVRLLDWEEAHVGFDKAVDGIPVDKRGVRAVGFEHTLWQMLEHIRTAQQDLLDFCVNPRYEQTLTWPDDYWPRELRPPAPGAWTKSVADFRAARGKLKQLARDADLFALVPTGTGHQTYLRAILLVVDHTAYHLGQVVAARRALGVWQ
jgi:uncharacterized damage-inducible protein DinB